jgi:hypothetical protein
LQSMLPHMVLRKNQPSFGWEPRPGLHILSDIKFDGLFLDISWHSYCIFE